MSATCSSEKKITAAMRLTVIGVYAACYKRNAIAVKMFKETRNFVNVCNCFWTHIETWTIFYQSLLLPMQYIAV